MTHGIGGPRSGDLTGQIPGMSHFGGGHFGTNNITRPKRSMDYHIDDIISTGPYKLAVPLKSTLKFTESTKWNQAEINIIQNDNFPNNGESLIQITLLQQQRSPCSEYSVIRYIEQYFNEYFSNG